MMSSKKYLLLAGVLLFSHNSYAGYNGEVSLDYSKVDSDELTLTLTELNAISFINSIPTNNGPLAESAFLTPTSSFSIVNESAKLKFTDSTLKSTQTLFGGSYVNPSKIFELDLKIGNTKNSSTDSSDSLKSNDSLIGFKFFVKKGVALGFSRESNKFKDTIGAVKSFEDLFFYRQLITLSSDQYLAFEFQKGKNLFTSNFSADDAINYNDVKVNYFTNKKTNFIFGIHKNKYSEPDFSDDTTYMLGFESFITPTVNLGITYLKFVDDDSTIPDESGLTFSLLGRF